MLNNSRSTKAMPKSVFAEPSDTYVLSPEQWKYYEDNGFLVIKQLIDFASLYSYKQRFIQICKGVVPKGMIQIIAEPAVVGKKQNPEDCVNKIQEIVFDDVFIEYARTPRLLHILKQLIGDDIRAIHSMLINKPPGTGKHPPHQDLYYFPYRPADKIVTSWTAIDHVTLDNGCLYVIPGSHKPREILPHGPIKNVMKLYHGVLNEEKMAPLEQRVHLEMSPGDTVFFHPCLVHGSGPNVSKNYRKALSFHFANSGCDVVDVRGTVQDGAAKEMEDQAKKKGYDLSFADIWKYKSREITGVKARL